MPHILTDISRRVGELATESGRHIHLVLENDDNRASILNPDAAIPEGQYRAQWNDDYHHSWHVLLTGETHGYYQDYAHAPRTQLAHMLAGGFAYQGEPSPHRGMNPRGEVSSSLTPGAFVTFVQNHDQIGNRPHGDRLTASVTQEALQAALAATLLAPMPPLLFMGEEWGSQRPFPFFCDFQGELAEAVRQGRKREFADAYADLAEPVPDPLSAATFEAAKLDWESLALPQSAARLSMVRDLLSIRKREIVPFFTNSAKRQASAVGDIVSAQWSGLEGRTLHLLANLGAHDATPDRKLVPGGRSIWGGAPSTRIAPWSVFWSVVEG